MLIKSVNVVTVNVTSVVDSITLNRISTFYNNEFLPFSVLNMSNLSITLKAASICTGYEVRALMQTHVRIKMISEFTGTKLIVKIGWVYSRYT